MDTQENVCQCVEAPCRNTLVGTPLWKYHCWGAFVGIPWPEYLYIGHKAKLLQEFDALLLQSPYLFMAQGKFMERIDDKAREGSTRQGGGK